MGENWVGFQKSPKLPAGEILGFSDSWKISQPVSSVVSAYTSADGFSAWFAKVEKFDSRRGGKISFVKAAEQFSGSFTHFDVPALVELVTDRYGLMRFSLDPDENVLKFELSMHSSGANADSIGLEYRSFCDALKAVTQ